MAYEYQIESQPISPETPSWVIDLTANVDWAPSDLDSMSQVLAARKAHFPGRQWRLIDAAGVVVTPIPYTYNMKTGEFTKG